jgi:hypothetical protein
MRRIAFSCAVLSILALATLTACGGSPAKTGSTGTSGSVSPSSKPTFAEPYPTITPVSANEKGAAGSTRKALASYIELTKAGNKQNKTDTQIFDNKQGYKPRFVGYEFTLLGPKGADGKYRLLQVGAFDGGKQIKPISLWENYGSVALGDGQMQDTWFEGTPSPSDPAIFTTGYKPESAGEKTALAAVEAWAKANTKAGAFGKTLLTSYLFVWGEVQERPNMIMSINPDGFSTGSVISWGAEK